MGCVMSFNAKDLKVDPKFIDYISALKQSIRRINTEITNTEEIKKRDEEYRDSLDSSNALEIVEARNDVTSSVIQIARLNKEKEKLYERCKQAWTYTHYSLNPSWFSRFVKQR